MPSSHIIYARRSSDRDDHQVLSIEQQLEVLRELAADRGIEVAEELVENASASDPGRPVFGDLMKKIRSGKVENILTWKLDRLARNMVDGGEIIYELTKGRLKEIVTPEATYTGSGDSKFMLTMLFGAAVKFTDDLSLAVKRGNQDVLRRGKVPGPVPIGYTKTHEHEEAKGSGIVIPDPERFPIVKRMWQEVLRGDVSVCDVWRKARDEWQLTTRPTKDRLAQPIALTSVYSIFQNPFYTGRILRAGKYYKGEHPPMLTWSQFEHAQALIRRKQPEVPRPEPDFLYHGLLHCGACSRMCTGERHEKGGHTYIYYRCGRRRSDRAVCHERAVTESEVTNALAMTFDTVTIDPTIREWAFEAVAWWAGDGDVSPEKLVTRAKRALKVAEDQLATLTDMAVRSMITEEEYMARRTNQLAKIEHFREALAEPLERREAWRVLREEKQRNGLHLGRDFREGDTVAKRKIAGRIVTDILVAGGVAKPVLRTPFVLRTNSTLSPRQSHAAC